MKQKINGQIILAFIIAMALVACKGKDKSDGKETITTGTEQTTGNDADMDALKAPPGLYKVLADTLGIRIVEVNYKPGDSSVMHWHPDYAIYAIQSGKSTFYLKDGSKMENELTAGMTLVSPAGSHSVKNTGSTDVKVMLFEVNRSGAVTSPDASMDAMKVAPDVYKIKNDTLGIRVLEVTVKPGGSVAMHSHPDGAIYVIEGGTVEFAAKDGTKMTNELKTGMAMVLPAETHSAKNTGKTTLKAILVEVNRAMK